MMYRRIVCATFFLFAVTGCGHVKEKGDTGTKNMQETKTTTEHKMVAEMLTSLGSIDIELYQSDAPNTVANFVGLAKEDYFNGVIFHRVVRGFVIQGGDSTGTGMGGRSIYGGAFEDELNPQTKSYQEGYLRGVVAMANSGPNTNRSQFFIMLADQPRMPKNYSIFGKVIKGMDVVDKIAAVELVPRGAVEGKPKVDVKMISVNVTER